MATVNLTWTAPTTHTDGTPVAAGEITGYQVYDYPGYPLDMTGTAVGGVVTAPAAIISDVAVGAHYYGVEALDTNSAQDSSVAQPYLEVNVTAAGAPQIAAPVLTMTSPSEIPSFNSLALTWTAPTTNVDGSALASGELLGYQILVNGAQAQSAGGTAFPVPGGINVWNPYSPGTYTVTVVAQASSDSYLNSAPSNAVTVTIVPQLSSPTNLAATVS